MAELKDSGARREFSSGAVRDIAEGKGRCDLLPLGEIGDWLFDRVLIAIDRYVQDGETNDLWGAICEFCRYRNWDIYTAMLEVSKQYEDGAKKYNERNWELGQNLHCYIDSGVRHHLKWRRGDTDEPHDRAFIWNMLGAIWTHENKPELIDLPFADMGDPTTENKPVEPWGKEDERRKQRIFRCLASSCPDCPLSLRNNDSGQNCGEYTIDHPAEARKIMDEMEGMK